MWGSERGILQTVPSPLRARPMPSVSLVLTGTLCMLLVSASQAGRSLLIEETCKDADGCNRMSAHSSLAEWHEEAYGPDYFTFTNVQLKGESLLFFKEEGKHWPESTSVPGMIPLNKDEAVIPLSVQQVTLSEEAQCSRFYQDTAVLLSGTPWDTNFYEMMANNVMPLWATVKELGLLDAQHYLSTSQTPESSNASFILIQARPEAYQTAWSYLFRYMTPKQLLLTEVDGACFSKLVVISDSILRFLVDRGFSSAAHKAHHDAKRQRYFQAFQRWMLTVEHIYQRSLGLPKPDKLSDLVPYSRPRVVFSSRPERWGGFQSRGIANEAEVAHFIEEQYDVNVTVVDFGSTLEPIMELVQSASLLLGMHGAGLMHALWLRPGSHFMQLAPYGFSPDGEHLIRGDYYNLVAAVAGCTTSNWVNPHAHKAIFHEEHFQKEGVGGFFQHPNETTPMPTDWNAPYHWIYQSTEVDLDSFGQSLHHAMFLLNIPRKLLV